MKGEGGGENWRGSVTTSNDRRQPTPTDACRLASRPQANHLASLRRTAAAEAAGDTAARRLTLEWLCAPPTEDEQAHVGWAGWAGRLVGWLCFVGQSDCLFAGELRRCLLPQTLYGTKQSRPSN